MNDDLWDRVRQFGRERTKKERRAINFMHLVSAKICNLLPIDIRKGADGFEKNVNLFFRYIFL